MPFEIFTENEIAQMSPEQREELEWPHLFWEGRHIWFTPGDDIEFTVHVRGSGDGIYEVQLRAPEPLSPPSPTSVTNTLLFVPDPDSDPVTTATR